MQDLLKQAKAFYLRNKVSDFEFDYVRNELYETNLAVLRVCSFVTAILAFVLGVFSIFHLHSRVLSPFYIYFAICLLLTSIFIVSLKLPKEKNYLSVYLVYAFIWIFNIYTGARGIYKNQDNYAVMFVTFTFVYPLIFVDKIRRIYLNAVIAALIFSVCSFLFKNLEPFKVDVFNVWSFLVLGYLPSFYLTKIRVREFSLRQIIENERDTDQLTGLLNKAAFIREAKRSINSTNDGILVILDLDFFKEINDTYGHFVGDHVLKLVSVCIGQVFRSSDLTGRFGGDEFVILMQKTNSEEIALTRCEQLLEKLNETQIFPDDVTNNTSIHASIGLAVYRGESDFDSLFKKADKALYDAKNSGKDRVCKFS